MIAILLSRNACFGGFSLLFTAKIPLIIILQFFPSFVIHCFRVSSSLSVQRVGQKKLPPDNAIANTNKKSQLMYTTGPVCCSPLEQPDIPEQSNNKGKEQKPHLPSHTRALCHTQHTIHRPLEFIARIRELIIHLFRQCSRIADLVADAQSKLFFTTISAICLPSHILSLDQGVKTHILQHANLLAHLRHLLIILRLQFTEHGIAISTAFIGCCRAETSS